MKRASFGIWGLLGFVILIVPLSCESISKYERRKHSEKCAMEARLMYAAEVYDSSFYYFKTSFDWLPWDDKDKYLYAAAASLHLGKDEEADKWIRAGIITASLPVDYFNAFYEFHPFRDRPIFTLINRDYQSFLNHKGKDRKIMAADREIKMMISRAKGARDFEDPNLIEKVDNNNISQLMELTNSVGWRPGAVELLWHHRKSYHQDKEPWRFFKTRINQEIAKGNVARNFWAIFDDFSSIDLTGMQIYGMFPDKLTENPIRDINRIDDLRAEVGLPPLWYMAIVEGYPLPQGYYKDGFQKAYFTQNL